VLNLAEFSAMIFGFYATTIIGVEKTTDSNPGKKHPNYLCIGIGIVAAASFLLTGFLIYLPAYTSDPLLKTWTPLFLFYGLELIGVVIGPWIESRI